jgi:hypothetical protein
LASAVAFRFPICVLVKPFQHIVPPPPNKQKRMNNLGILLRFICIT